MQYIGAEVNSYITQKRTKANKKRYCDKYRSKRDVKESKNSHSGDEEEEKKEPANNPKLEKGGRDGNAFGRANNGKVI